MKRNLDRIAFSFLSASLWLLALAFLSEDKLAYRSDGWSLAVVFLTAALPLAALLSLLPERARGLMLAASIPFGLAVTVLSPWLALPAFVGILLFLRRRDLAPWIGRLRPLAYASLLLPPLLGLLAPKPRPALVDKPNVVMLVLDGLGAEAVQELSAELAQRGRVFSRFYTNFPYTHGFFHCLYTGHKISKVENEHLFQWLQAEGVTTRWIAHHRNAVPETSVGQSYRGLRAGLLSENYLWLPRLLGLDYDVFRGSLSARHDYLLWALNAPFPVKESVELIVEEIENLRTRGSHFLLAHTYYDMDSPERELSEWGQKIKSPARNKMTANDYHYGPEDDPQVEKWRKRKRLAVERGSARLRRLVDIFFAKGWHEDTLLIVTADHGTMFDRGKVWYGFHNDDEVTRVPFFLFGRGVKPGIDDRMFETVDITRTILDTYGIEKYPSPRALSVTGNAAKTRVSTLSLVSKKRNEQMLTVYLGDRKYETNLMSPRPGALDPAIWREVFDEFGLHVAWSHVN